jgi:hypothetical protein
MVKDHYLNLGFLMEDNNWMLPLNNFIDKKSFIIAKN